MAHDVFISHSARNKATADAVCAMLESEGIRCWIAPRDVTPGMEWGECIIEAIEQARIMVLVFTAEANASPQIRREVERAVSHGVAILPVRIEDVLPSKALEYFIGNVHWLDALTPPLQAHLKGLAGTVRVLLARMKVSPTPPPAPHESLAAAAPPHPSSERQNAGTANPAAFQPVMQLPAEPGAPVKPGGASGGFHFWGTHAWTWAGGAVSVVLLAVFFIGNRLNSHSSSPAPTPLPVAPNSTPLPQAIPQPSPDTQPTPSVGVGRHAPTNAPAAPPPTTNPASDELRARQLMQSRNYQAALPVAQRACDEGVMNGCNLLGMLYGNGWGVPQNFATARQLYQQACNGGEVSGCGNLGFLYVKGSGVPQNIPEGKALLQKACNAGRTWSCSQLQQLR